MILAHCPCCRETIRLPESPLAHDIQAKCPWCLETFPVRDLLPQLPPVVKLFDHAGQPFELAELPVATAMRDEPPSAPHSRQPNEDQQPEASAPSSEDTVLIETWTDEQDPLMRTDAAGTDETIDDANEFLEAHVAPHDAESLVTEEFEMEDELMMDETMEENDESTSDLHDFRITESGAISDVGYEVISSESSAIGLDEIKPDVSAMNVRATPRTATKRSPWKTLLGIAVGPLLALPIAGIIFYFLGTDLGFWPLDGGRSRAPSAFRAAPLGSDLRVKPPSNTDRIPKDSAQATPLPELDFFETQENDSAVALDSELADQESLFPEPISAADSLMQGDGLEDLSLPMASLVPQDAPALEIPALEAPDFEMPQDEVDAGAEEQSVNLDAGFWAPPESIESLAMNDRVAKDPASRLSPPASSEDSVTAPVDQVADQETMEIPDDLSAETFPARAATGSTDIAPPEPETELDALIIPETDAEVSADNGLAVPDARDVAESKVPETTAPPMPEPRTNDSVTASEEPLESESADSVPLKVAIEDARARLDSLENLSPSSDKYKPALAWTYATVASVGDLQQGPPSARVESLLATLGTSSRLNDFAAAVPQWLATSKRTNEGVFLLGRPATNENGPCLKLDSGVEISVTSDSKLMTGSDPVIALGRIQQQTPRVIIEIVAVQLAP